MPSLAILKLLRRFWGHDHLHVCVCERGGAWWSSAAVTMHPQAGNFCTASAKLVICTFPFAQLFADLHNACDLHNLFAGPVQVCKQVTIAIRWDRRVTTRRKRMHLFFHDCVLLLGLHLNPTGSLLCRVEKLTNCDIVRYSRGDATQQCTTFNQYKLIYIHYDFLS